MASVLFRDAKQNCIGGSAPCRMTTVPAASEHETPFFMQQFQLFDLDTTYPPHPLIARMALVYEKCKRLREKLSDLGFLFEYPDKVIGGPAKDVDAKLFPLKTEFGTFPEALRQFYLILGSVNFSGHHPEWIGCDDPEPLRVKGIDQTVREYNCWVGGKPLLFEKVQLEPFAFSISPDYYIEANVSGGTYDVYFSSGSWDPIIEDHCGGKWTFCQHLEHSLSWGGFPGLKRAKNHAWPLEKLVKAVDPGSEAEKTVK